MIPLFSCFIDPKEICDKNLFVWLVQNKEVLEFMKIVMAREQVVEGKMYHHFALEANEGGQTKNFEAKVWVKPWMNFKQLHEFKESSS